MRWATIAAAIALSGALAAAPAAMAAPTCWNAAAEVVRCGTSGALPAGAKLTPDQQALRRERETGAPAAALIGLTLVLGGLFALFALLPDFDGWDARSR